MLLVGSSSDITTINQPGKIFSSLFPSLSLSPFFFLLPIFSSFSSISFFLLPISYLLLLFFLYLFPSSSYFYVFGLFFLFSFAGKKHMVFSSWGKWWTLYWTQTHTDLLDFYHFHMCDFFWMWISDRELCSVGVVESAADPGCAHPGASTACRENAFSWDEWICLLACFICGALWMERRQRNKSVLYSGRQAEQTLTLGQ